MNEKFGNQSSVYPVRLFRSHLPLVGSLAGVYARSVSANVSKASKANRGPSATLPSAGKSSSSNSRRWLFLGAGLILFLTFLAYQPAVKSGFIWDDDDLLTENPLIKGGLRDIWFTTKFYDYYPLTLTSLWLEWRIWGLNPTGYHVVNILLHTLTAILFWRVLLQLKISGAWLAALVFALHPVNVESVAWIAERKNTLPMVFYGLAILWFLKAQGGETGSRRQEPGVQTAESRITNYVSPWYWLSIAAFLLALLSKTSVVMLPFVLLGCTWWRLGKIVKSDFLRTLPFFALSLVLGLVTVWVQYNRAISTDIVQTSGFFERLARAGWAVWFYLGKALLPLELSFVYPRWEVDPRSVISYLPGIAVFACLGVFWKFRQSWGKPFLFAFGYFVVTLFPVLGFFSIYFQKYSFVADHWQYTSIIGIIALVIGVGAHFQKKLPALAVIGFVAVAALSVQTFRQSSIYKNDDVLFRDTIAKNPKCWLAWHNLGVELMMQANFFGERGNREAAFARLNEAIQHFSETLKLKPDHANCHYNLGRALMTRGNMDEALAEFREAVRYDPEIVGAAQPVAWVYATSHDDKKRNGREAVRLAEIAAKVTEQEDPLVLDTLAAAYAEVEKFDDAVSVAFKAVEVAEKSGDPDFAKEIRSRIRFYKSGRPYRE